ncbi:MAG: hypothetical protein OXG38_00655 [Chloroflexi bacterium]|nr:hypothetical protein [Chloroflexota bacterium]
MTTQRRTRPATRRQFGLPALVLGALVVAALAAIGLGAVAMHARVSAQTPAQGLDDVTGDAVAGHRFSLLDFEFGAVFSHWLGDLGAVLSGRHEDGPAADALVRRYFDLRTDLAEARAASRSDTVIARLEAERAAIENRVERILEHRVGDELRRSGFARPLPLFGDQALLWPPVDVELTRPPRVLTVSPREEIRIARSVLLDPELSLPEMMRLEAEVEADGRWSALVQGIGGLGSYPAIVHEARSYAATVNTIAHEWTHNYLFFYPLGFHFFDSRELRTMNETVANMVGDEIAESLQRAHPAVRPRELPTADRTESDAVLAQLRRDVDALLAAGRIEDGEALMEATRLELVDLGRNFRRINQAFFAARGVYADTAASSSPIGALLLALRGEADSLAAFIAIVREFDSLAELEAAVQG